MKVAPILRSLVRAGDFEPCLVHTGQHYDAGLSEVFFRDLGLPRPDVELEVGSGSHAGQTAEIMRRFEAVLATEQPRAVVVVGDVNSTLACALVASKFQLERPFPIRGGTRTRPLVAHVEAGLRSFDDDMPEEINRRLTDVVSDLLFVSEPSGLTNLAREGIATERIFFVGNVMIDSLLAVRDRARESSVLESLGLTDGRYGVLTLHRPSNVDDPTVLQQLVEVLDATAAQVPLVFPVHPRTRGRLAGVAARLVSPRWRLVEPLGYVDFIRLLSSARVVLTDSGGIQEETTVLGVPCVTLRTSTERPVTVTEGTNLLAGTDRGGIESAIEQALRARPEARVPKFWDGQAADRVVAALSEHLRIP